MTAFEATIEKLVKPAPPVEFKDYTLVLTAGFTGLVKPAPPNLLTFIVAREL